MTFPFYFSGYRQQPTVYCLTYSLRHRKILRRVKRDSRMTFVLSQNFATNRPSAIKATKSQTTFKMTGW